MRRWSNQCAVVSCSARNRVSGGVSVRPVPRPDRVGDRRPPAGQRPGHVPTRGRHPRRPADAGEELGDRAGLAVGDDESLAVAGPAGVERRDQGVHGVVDVGRVDRAPHRCRARAAGPARARVDDRGRPAGCRRGPTPGAVGRRARRRSGRRRAEREELGRGLGPRVVARGPPRVGGPAPAPHQGSTGVRDRRRGDVDQPAHALRAAGVDDAAGALDVGRGRSPRSGPTTSTLAARCTTASCPRTARRDGVASATSPSTSRQSMPDGRRCSTVTSSPRSASSAAAARPSIPLAPVTRTLTGLPHEPPRPASTTVGPTGDLERSTLEACRMSTGSRSATSTAATGVPATPARRGPGRAARAEPERAGHPWRRDRPSRARTTTTTTCCARRARPRPRPRRPRRRRPRPAARRRPGSPRRRRW